MKNVNWCPSIGRMFVLCQSLEDCERRKLRVNIYKSKALTAGGVGWEELGITWNPGAHSNETQD